LSLQAIAERIRAAADRKLALRLRGGGSKDFYGNEARGELLDTRAYAGIIDYEPSELVLTARCGTPLSQIEGVLNERGQCLPFEPPHFGAATFGGCVAAGLSGPRRASAGALRDFVLGVKLVDGRGRLLQFGGQVMKNVAGYDVSRLVAGSLGTLGLIAEASLKVLPRPAVELTLRLEMDEAAALDTMNRWAGEPLPISATAWHAGVLAVRLSGSDAAVGGAARRIGGAEVDYAWHAIREQTHPFFAGDAPLWRLAVPSVTPPLGDAQLIEWGGGLRWAHGESAAQMRDIAKRAGGHATLFRAADKSAGAFAPLEPVVMRLHRALKSAFDPAGILNPGRLYPEL
jgi:glycolate oxidase FAD binding subunit